MVIVMFKGVTLAACKAAVRHYPAKRSWEISGDYFFWQWKFTG